MLAVEQEESSQKPRGRLKYQARGDGLPLPDPKNREPDMGQRDRSVAECNYIGCPSSPCRGHAGAMPCRCRCFLVPPLHPFHEHCEGPNQQDGERCCPDVVQCLQLLHHRMLEITRRRHGAVEHLDGNELACYIGSRTMRDKLGQKKLSSE